MTAMQMESPKLARVVPDFTFPPKFNCPSTIVAEVITTVSLKTKLISSEKDSPTRDPSPRPTYLPEILTPITPLEPQVEILSAVEPGRGCSRLKLLTIPFEIRLQIYSYVLLSHPAHHAHVSPLVGAISNQFHISLFKPQGLSLPTSPASRLISITSLSSTSSLQSTTDDCPTSRTQHQTVRHQGSPAPRPSKIPTALLTANRQIYNETRDLPFQTSFFEFVNWFWSGVNAARQFTRALRPWQSDSLRFVAVEVLGRDLWVGGMDSLGGGIGIGCSGKEIGVGEWRELCGLWRGVRGLRLRIGGSVLHGPGSSKAYRKVEASESESDTASSFVAQQFLKERGILNTHKEWVVDGLLRMESLRWVECEIEDEDVARDIKIEFCAELQRTLTESRCRDDGWMDDVKVAFVEAFVEKEEGKWCPDVDEAWHSFS